MISGRTINGRPGERVSLENVECRSDSAYGERPLAFTWQGERFEVIGISLRWRSPDGKGFRVSTRQGRAFDLFYSETLDAWAIQEL